MALRRDGTALPVTSDTQLRQGDRLTILTPTEHANTFIDRLQQEMAGS
jgi:Trk K+ transport system NAD-binding subunit